MNLNWKQWANNVVPGDVVVLHPGDGTTEERTVWAVSKRGQDAPRFSLDNGLCVSYLKCTPISINREIERGQF